MTQGRPRRRLTVARAAGAMLVLCTLMAASAQGQLFTRVDVEAASVRVPGTERQHGVVVSPSLRGDVWRLTLDGSGGASLLTERDSYSYLLVGAASADLHLPAPGALEIAVGARASRAVVSGPGSAVVAPTPGTAASSRYGDVALSAGAALPMRTVQLWVSGERRAMLGGTVRRPWSAEVGASHVMPWLITSATLQTTRFERRSTHVAAFGGPTLGSYALHDGGWRPARHTDLRVSATFAMRRAELSLEGGARVAGTADRERWGSAAASWRLREGLTAIGSLGGYPVDHIRGIPRAHFATLGLRLERGRPHDYESFRVPDAPPFRIDTLQGGARVIHLRAPRATRVELSGDFTDWTAVPMRDAGSGEWELVLPIAPGTYRVSLRVDGGRWRAPPGLVSVDDEFNGEVAVVIIR